MSLERLKWNALPLLSFIFLALLPLPGLNYEVHAWTEEVHYYLTYLLAVDVGFSEAQAYLIASADERIDEDSDTDPQETLELLGLNIGLWGDVEQCVNWHAFLFKGNWAKNRQPGEPLGFRGGFENYLLGLPEFDTSDPGSLISKIAAAEGMSRTDLPPENCTTLSKRIE